MDVAALLESLQRAPGYAGQLAHVEILPERIAEYQQPRRALPERLHAALVARGIDALYTHQAECVDLARAGQDWVVVTGTASGKSLGYHLPVLEQTLAEPNSRALYLFPTKALAQDQFKGLTELCAESLSEIVAGVFDGDTPVAQRRRIQAEAHLVLSNPDMLHASILPYHPKWARFFSSLKFIVLDEVHTYRGILGAHVACVLRRLARVCEHYGSQPVVLCASATIANPGELASKLIGRPVKVVSTDGSPRGKKYFALWNPAPLGRDQLARRSASDDAVDIMSAALQAGAQALTFTRTRQQAELVQRYLRDALTEQRSPFANQVRAYRGGYLPNERRQMEADLFSGKLRGVAATNALELGIDVGSLDVTILSGYPGTIASTWQQAGRSGRRQGESLAMLIASNDPVDQFLLNRPDYFFAQTPEQAVVDPENPYVLARHLKAAAFELPLAQADLDRFGAMATPVAGVLADSGELSSVGEKFYFSGQTNPAARISLRHMSDNTFSIVLRKPGTSPQAPDSQRADFQAHEVIANVDAISAPELVYPEAVYLHNGETYFVRKLDLEGKVAYVERHEMDYYTQAVLESNVRVTGPRQTTDILGGQIGFGDVDVTWQTVAFKKIKFGTRENIGLGPVEIPAQTLSTTALWFTPDATTRAVVRGAGQRASEGLCGLRNLAVVALPMLAMCDSRDLGGVCESQNFGQSTMILYDRYPGGLGYCQKGMSQFARLLALCQEIIAACGCSEGCPSCVGIPNLRPAIHSDPDLMRGAPMPNKGATESLLSALLVEPLGVVCPKAN
jgi:DEAD/DEAH box helicase domain-containing protein